jgi:hypothetical protein
LLVGNLLDAVTLLSYGLPKKSFDPLPALSQNPLVSPNRLTPNVVKLLDLEITGGCRVLERGLY